MYEFIVGAGIGALLIASGLIVGQAFSALMLSIFGLGPLIFFLLSVVLIALVVLVAYTYLMEVGSPCFITGLTVFASIPAIRLPSYMTWAF